MAENQVYINNEGSGFEEALEMVERFSDVYSLSSREALHLRLLAEETMGMVRAMVGEFDAFFSMEGGDMPYECRIILDARTKVTSVKRSELLGVTSTGKNEAAKGFMGKIRELFETGMESFEEVNDLNYTYGGGNVSYGMMGMTDGGAMSQAVYTWSLQKYRDSVSEDMEENEACAEAWDELEKSIVANLADDITVGIRKNSVEMVIYKKFEYERVE